MGAVSLFGLCWWMLDAKSAERTDTDRSVLPRAVAAVPLDLNARLIAGIGGGQVGVAPTSR